MSPGAAGQADQVAAVLRDTFDGLDERPSQTYARGLVAGLIGAKASIGQAPPNQVIRVDQILAFLDSGLALYLDVCRSLGVDLDDLLPEEGR